MHKKFVVIVLIVISTLLGVIGYFANTQYEENTPFEIPPENVNMASMTNYNNINSIFAEKLAIMQHLVFSPRYMSPLYKQRTMDFIH